MGRVYCVTVSLETTVYIDLVELLQNQGLTYLQIRSFTLKTVLPGMGKVSPETIRFTRVGYSSS